LPLENILSPLAELAEQFPFFSNELLIKKKSKKTLYTKIAN